MRSSSPTPDYDFLFLKGLLPELRAMNHRQKLRFKCEVYKVVNDIMGDSSSPSRATSIPKRRCQRSRHQNRSSNYHQHHHIPHDEQSYRYRNDMMDNDIRTNTNSDTNLVSSIVLNMNAAKVEPNVDDA